jgi:hypothetical protein
MNLVNCSEQNASVRDFSNIFLKNKNDSLWHLESMCSFIKVDNTSTICMLLYENNDEEGKT